MKRRSLRAAPSFTRGKMGGRTFGVQSLRKQWPVARLGVGWPGPEVLLSGPHANLRRWRLKQALGRTWLRRPDLLEARRLSAEESKLLEEFKREER